MIKQFTLFLTLLVTLSTSHAEVSCSDLVKYRDTQLITDFDKAVRKLNSANNSLALVKQLQSETQSLRDKQPTINQVFQLVLSVQTTNNVIANILKLNPETDVLINTAGQSGKWVQRIINTNKSVEITQALSNSNLDTYLFWDMVGDSQSLGTAIKGIHDFTNDIQEQRENYQDGNEILDNLDDQLKQLNKLLFNAQQRVNNQTIKIETINHFKNSIDEQCN